MTKLDELDPKIRTFFDSAMKIVENAREMSAKHANSKRWRGPDSSALSIDPALIRHNLEKTVKCDKCYSAFSYGVMVGIAAQYRFQMIVETALSDLQRPLSKGRARTYKDSAEQAKAHTVIREVWDDLRPRKKSDEAAAMAIQRMLASQGLVDPKTRKPATTRTIKRIAKSKHDKGRSS
ncbi:MAG TPA: hypothetical protein VMR25_07810 [Planctomycetaceae bacterium]|jgi:DNA helicase IV|nr:hypothetical protein [Planctomycetaceae bacterium]